MIDNSPFQLKKKVMGQYVFPTMTYGYPAWSLNKQLTNKQRRVQRVMEWNMLCAKLQDKIACSEIRKRTKENWHYRIHTETKVKIGWTYSNSEGQQVEITLHRVTTNEREEIQQSCMAKSEMLDIRKPLYQIILHLA